MEVVFLNLGPPSKVSIAEANSDIRAILATGPAGLMGVEAFAKGRLPKAPPGYNKIRDMSNPGRSNLYAYLKNDAVPTYRFTDGRVKFKREPGKPGWHPPRSLAGFTYNKVHFTLAHHPPGWPGTAFARVESLEMIQRQFAPWTDETRWARMQESSRKHIKAQARMLLWDRNMKMPQFRAFAETCDAWVVGEEIDSAMYRNLTILDPGYTRVFDGHKVHTDHPWGAFVLKFSL